MFFICPQKVCKACILSNSSSDFNVFAQGQGQLLTEFSVATGQC